MTTAPILYLLLAMLWPGPDPSVGTPQWVITAVNPADGHAHAQALGDPFDTLTIVAPPHRLSRLCVGDVLDGSRLHIEARGHADLGYTEILDRVETSPADRVEPVEAVRVEAADLHEPELVGVLVELRGSFTVDAVDWLTGELTVSTGDGLRFAVLPANPDIDVGSSLSILRGVVCATGRLVTVDRPR